MNERKVIEAAQQVRAAWRALDGAQKASVDAENALQRARHEEGQARERYREACQRLEIATTLAGEED